MYKTNAVRLIPVGDYKRWINYHLWKAADLVIHPKTKLLPISYMFWDVQLPALSMGGIDQGQRIDSEGTFAILESFKFIPDLAGPVVISPYQFHTHNFVWPLYNTEEALPGKVMGKGAVYTLVDPFRGHGNKIIFLLSHWYFGRPPNLNSLLGCVMIKERYR